MSRQMRRLDGFVDAITRDRRPRRFRAGAEDQAAMRAAALLHASRSGAAEPATGFVDDLARRLRESIGAADAREPDTARRRFLKLGGLAAAAAVAGAVGGRAAQPSGSERGEGVLTPDQGRWLAVSPVSALPPGRLLRFSAGGVEGFVVNRGGNVSAVSAVCTHMGCILNGDAPAGRLRCPCHGSSFSLDGKPASSAYELPSLPQIQTRNRDGHIEVLVT